MKKIKYILFVLVSILLVGCGKKEEVKEPTYVDGNISVTDITGEIQGVDSTEEALISDEEWNVLQEAPRTDVGTFDTSHFSKEQLEIYEKLLTNKYIDFTNDEAREAAIAFFSSDINTLGYKEYASVTFNTKYLESEEGKDLANVVYSGVVEDRRTNMKVNGTVEYFTEDYKSYELEAFLSKTDNYYYVLLGQDLSQASSLSVDNSDLYDLFNDLAFIFKKIDEVVVVDTTSKGYLCEFTVPSDIIVESTLLNKQYANSIFSDYGVETKGYLYINTETKKIDTVEFKQILIDKDKYGEDIDIDSLINSDESVAMATYEVGYTFTEFNENYDFVMDDRETAEIMEAYYFYLMENKEETEILLNGGTENDINEYHKTEAEKELERQLLEQLEQQAQQAQQEQ